VVGARTENQQERIDQGVKSGELTQGEAKNLDTKEAKLHQEVSNARAANGGKLTPAERARVNRQQNRMSHEIYRDKHNAQTAR
jgi:FtsZ-binding cell division protein ZapB